MATLSRLTEKDIVPFLLAFMFRFVVYGRSAEESDINSAYCGPRVTVANNVSIENIVRDRVASNSVDNSIAMDYGNGGVECWCCERKNANGSEIDHKH